MIFGIAVLIVVLVIWNLLKRSGEDNQGWKFRKVGNDKLEYSEIIDGSWEPIEFKLVLYDNNVPRHAIYVPKDWLSYPVWAQEHREIILRRMQKTYRSPEFSIIVIG